jgi:hypothetical protein
LPKLFRHILFQSLQENLKVGKFQKGNWKISPGHINGINQARAKSLPRQRRRASSRRLN